MPVCIPSRKTPKILPGKVSPKDGLILLAHHLKNTWRRINIFEYRRDAMHRVYNCASIARNRRKMLRLYNSLLYFCEMTEQANNPLHGKTLEAVLNALVAHYGWKELGERIRINCFTSDPSVKSSLKFLRKTPWARAKVEDLYVSTPSSILIFNSEFLIGLSIMKNFFRLNKVKNLLRQLSIPSG